MYFESLSEYSSARQVCMCVVWCGVCMMWYVMWYGVPDGIGVGVG